MSGGSQKSSGSSGGFNALSKDIKSNFNTLARNTTDLLLNGNGNGMFTPGEFNSDQLAAFDILRTGVAPNADSIGSDIAMQMNSFDNYVIDGINREAVGDYSQVKQAMNNVGTLGSNRDILGANDVDLSRLQKIGQFNQSQYNTALNNALTVLPAARMQDAQNQLGVGQTLYDRATQLQQAPYAALAAAAQLMGVQPTKEGSSTSKSSGANFALW
jgi:hypothetical protein